MDLLELKLPANVELVIVVQNDEHALFHGKPFTIILQTPRHLIWHKRVHTQRIVTSAVLETCGLQKIVNDMAHDIEPIIDLGGSRAERLQREIAFLTNELNPLSE